MTLRSLTTQACLALLVVAGCSKTHEDPISTETGNPPVIEQGLIELIVIGDEAHVVGDRGAIDPPRGEVEVSIERTDDVARGPVEDDGSFDVEVDARLGDAFSLRVIVDGEASPRVRFAGRGSDAGMSEPADSGPVGADDAAVSDASGTCAECIDEEIRWRRIDPDGVFPELPGLRFTLRGCNTFMTQNDALEKCTRSVEQCMAGMGSVSIATVKAALEADAVQAALDEGGEHGEAATVESFMYEISVGDRTITYRSCHAGPDAEIACTDSPALEGFVGRLTQLADANACAPVADCDSPFDPGEGGSETEVWYWHDPRLNACLPKPGTAGGGSNGNRYASHVECLEACPEPRDEADCDDERIWRDAACFQCGLTGGCLYMQSFCPLPCRSDAECGPDNPVTTDIELVCRAGVCGPMFLTSCE